ncbi:MAG: TrbI/VirB10 family protein [Sphingomicrobium sp.]
MTDPALVNRPLVARPGRPNSVTGFAVVLALTGAGVFAWLSEARAANDGADALPLLTASTAAPAAQPLAVQAAAAPQVQTAALSGQFAIPNSGPVTLVPSTAAAPQPFTYSSQPPPAAPGNRIDERMRAPTLVVDFAQAEVPRPPGTSAPAAASDGGPRGTPADRNLSETERFSERVGNEEVQVARAQRMTGLDRLVPQGALIGAVMETALNSDLPGFARAVTQRDVYSFDGSAVLIPAGSRVIGQYKSGVAQGASRVFILWTRLIRPDGASIELASPAVDELGRGGLGGKVNRHFFQQFGGAILTSVLTGGISAASAGISGGSTIFVGSAGEAASLAGNASRNAEIPPTITTRQGAVVRIFVARDLDFSRVGPAR